MSENETEKILKEVLGHLLIEHGLPWTLDYDWTTHVVAKDGTIIAKCSHSEQARAIIRYAERLQVELEEAGREIERMLAAGEI